MRVIQLYDQGRPLNPNFSDYRLPTAGDVPPFEQVSGIRRFL